MAAHDKKTGEILRNKMGANLRVGDQGPDLILNTCGKAPQYQQFTVSATGQLKLTANTKMCVDISGYDTSPGAEVYTWSCGDGCGDCTNEQWIVSGTIFRD